MSFSGKSCLSFFLPMLLAVGALGQDADRLTKVSTLDSTIETLYGVISGEAGEKRDWELFKFLFTDDAQLLPSYKDENGKITYLAMSPEGYIERSGAYLEKNGFFEKEINRVEESFGQVTHIFSTYESYRSEKDEKPFARGINSIQLLKSEDRWWIVNVYWTAESEENPIPEKYLP